jgi:hypothetical protein
LSNPRFYNKCKSQKLLHNKYTFSNSHPISLYPFNSKLSLFNSLNNRFILSKTLLPNRFIKLLILLLPNRFINLQILLLPNKFCSLLLLIILNKFYHNMLNKIIKSSNLLILKRYLRLKMSNKKIIWKTNVMILNNKIMKNYKKTDKK